MSDPASDNTLRIIYKEFLAETKLYLDAGLDKLPERLGAALGVAPADAIEHALTFPVLDPLSLDQLRDLLAIRDMDITSRTASAISTELKEPGVTYTQCCRVALMYAVAELVPHVFAALRAAAGKQEDWARHHYLYGLILGAFTGDRERAVWELDLALQREPYESGRIRMRAAMELLETPAD